MKVFCKDVVWLLFPFLKTADVLNVISVEHVLILPDFSKSIFNNTMDSSQTEEELYFNTIYEEPEKPLELGFNDKTNEIFTTPCVPETLH